MANEINIQIRATYVKASNQITGSTNVTATQAGSHALSNTQSVGTSDETIDLGDIATAGPIMITNLDATNYVEIDSASTYDKFPQKLLPGESILIRPETVTIHAKAHTAPCLVQIVAMEL